MSQILPYENTLNSPICFDDGQASSKTGAEHCSPRHRAASHTSSLPVCRLGNGSKVTYFKPTIRVRGSKSATIEKAPTPPECLAEACRAAPGSRLKCDHPRSRRLRREGARGLDAAIPAANQYIIYREPGHPVVIGGGGAYYLFWQIRHEGQVIWERHLSDDHALHL